MAHSVLFTRLNNELTKLENRLDNTKDADEINDILDRIVELENELNEFGGMN